MSFSFRTLRTALLALLLAVVPVAGVVQAQSQLAGLTAQDKAQGSQAHPAIVQEFGGKIDGPLADYVRRVGLKVALAASPGSRPQDWTITVLDSPVPNAMATPGGYLYITRGLLGMINSEAELASVLGHEAGHVAARHTDKRNSRATIAGIGSILAGVLLGGDAGQIANTVGSGYVAGYSRSQEHEADQLGLRYAAAAGYDPTAAARMLAALERVSEVEGRQSMERGGLQSIFASHPVTRERINRVSRMAEQMKVRGADNSSAYLSAIDGMAWGDSVDQGMVSGRSFRHATLQLGFDAPAGFQLQNSPQAVIGVGPNGAQFRFQGAQVRPGDSLENIVSTAWSQLLQGSRPQVSFTERQVNRLDSVQTSARGRSGRTLVDMGITAYRFAPDTVYLFTTVAPAGQSAIFQPLLDSMRRLDTKEVSAAGKGRHIDVVTVTRGDTLASLAARQSPPYNRVESLAALNGITDGKVTPGDRIKLIVG
ncbi:MAG: M48 family metalloprotease [Sphingomonadaceae bacterium]